METMTPQHERWTEFYNRLSVQVEELGCKHTTTSARFVLGEMGLDEGAVRTSLAALAEVGGFCDCEILMNVGADPGDGKPEPGPDGDDPEGRLDLQQHKAFGRTLCHIDGFLNRLNAQLQRTYGNAASLCGAGAAGFARHVVGTLRERMAAHAKVEYPTDEDAVRAYYPEGQLEITNLGDVDLQRCLKCGLGESAYRRGVAQALSMAGDLAREGATADDLDQLTDLSMDWRYGRQPSVTNVQELVQAWRSGERGVTGLDLSVLAGDGNG